MVSLQAITFVAHHYLLSKYHFNPNYIVTQK